MDEKMMRICGNGKKGGGLGAKEDEEEDGRDVGEALLDLLGLMGWVCWSGDKGRVRGGGRDGEELLVKLVVDLG